MLLIGSACLVPAAGAQTYTIVHAFTSGADGATPQAGLTMDAVGNFYGTATFGGYTGNDACRSSGCGVVFKLAHGGTGWVIEPLYQFLAGSDGDAPLSRVVFGPDGALYGTTQSGGNDACAGGAGCGTVYRMTPPARLCSRVSCQWNESVLHAFTSGIDGAIPYYGDLTFNAAGDLFGTTALGGVHNQGTLFQLSRNNGVWTERVAYGFGGGPAQYPGSGVAFDSTGNIYGTTPQGGSPYGSGLIYELQPLQGGWTERTLFTFTTGTDGSHPGGGLIFDQLGNLYGTTASEGPGTNGGTVFELVRSGTGWTLSTLSGIVGGSGGPIGILTMDAAGNLYGTTYSDGAYGYGSVFKLAPQHDGTWLFTTLYDFTGFDDGRWPIGNVVVDASGNLWGTASRGGDRTRCSHLGCGVIWEITP
jgi:uncharacterized repeat protein (TIGR03803 family)